MASKRRRAAEPDGAGADLADAEVPMGEWDEAQRARIEEVVRNHEEEIKEKRAELVKKQQADMEKLEAEAVTTRLELQKWLQVTRVPCRTHSVWNLRFADAWFRDQMDRIRRDAARNTVVHVAVTCNSDLHSNLHAERSFAMMTCALKEYNINDHHDADDDDVSWGIPSEAREPEAD